MTRAKKLTGPFVVAFPARFAFFAFAFLALFALDPRLGARAHAAEPSAATAAAKEVTLKGNLGCGKCSFHEAKACENVLKVKHADASGHGEVEDSYLLTDNEVSRANHEKVCGPASPATVTGTVSERAPAAQKKARKGPARTSPTPARKLLTATSITFE